MEIKKLSEKLILAAGPCSAESPKQVLTLAKDLSSAGIRIFRAGLWKPRTMAGQFEGVGEKGLPWLLEAREATGMQLATEIANPHHAELCINAGIDILWIGARTVSNPFAVQELAEALRGYQGKIWIKNPISPELHLWVGAFNRFEQTGVTNISAVHRGFANYDRTEYRNLPRWDIPIELKRLRPETLIICDPSHMGGKPELLLPISQFALDLNYDGLMIESHCNPPSALSDASQQVTPAEMINILSSLKVRDFSPADHRLNRLRGQIDECDTELLSLLERRMEICREIGKLKKEENMPVLQSPRYNKMLIDRLQTAEKLGLDQTFIKNIFETIHLQSIALQRGE